MPIQPFRVRVCLSGLILFVRNAESKRITHALFRSTPEVGDDHHDPFFCHRGGLLGCKSSTSCRLERERVAFQWWRRDDRGREQQVPGDAGGAGPLGWPGDLKRLPDPWNPESSQLFYWVPQLDLLADNAKVDGDCYADPNPDEGDGEEVEVPPTVAAQVLLSEGTLRTGDFAYSAESRDSTVEWIPALTFKNRDGRTRGREQAAAETVIWELTAPGEAQWLQVVSKSLDAPYTERELARFDVVPEGVRNLTLSNNPPPESMGGHDPSRLPGGEGVHFARLYDFLDGPPEQRPIPRVPDTYRKRDPDSGSKPLRNVLPYVPRATEFEDCHRFAPTEGREHFVQDSEGTRERPICVPAVADT